jgi:GTPase SAR1 family protein
MSGTPDLHDVFASSELQKALDCIERHRANPEGEGIEVPGICVAGAQSAGKSSVLESISRISFPRGDTMCTRCPSVVSLERDDTLEEPVVLLSKDSEYSNPKNCALGEETVFIEELTNGMTKSGMITHEPIYIRVRMKGCPTLTLTDLPGITCNCPDPGVNIEEATVNLTTEYIKRPGNIILVVIPGSEDFNNPKALKLAKDLAEERTIGVVTKVDSLHADSDIIEKIRMEREGDVRLPQGFIAVRNRTKNETDLSVEAVREKERELFTTDPKLKHLKPEEWGIATLTQKIVDIQSSVVGDFMPNIKATLKQKIDALGKELQGLQHTFATPEESNGRYLEIVIKLVRDFEDTFTG